MFYAKRLAGLKTKKEAWNVITIDGVVGVGKTTLMKILVEERGMIPFQEPVMENPILDKFYYDRKRYSFPLQIFFLNERFKHIQKASKLDNAVLDRSIYGDCIFAKMLRDSGEMTEEEFDIYLRLFDTMVELCHPPKLMVYLEVSPEEAVKRIVKRGREYELDTEMDYWVRLNQEYRKYFAEYNFSPVLKINVEDLDFETNPEDKAYVLGLIDEKLAEIEQSERNLHAVG